MSNKSISELDEVSSINDSDLFVLQQDGRASSVTGKTLGAWLETLATNLTVKDQTITYAAGNSSLTRPSESSFSSTMPTVASGSYLWMRIVINYTNGTSSNPCYLYVRQGVDGSGAVNSVNNKSGNVTLYSSDIALSSTDSTTISSKLSSIQSSVSALDSKVVNLNTSAAIHASTSEYDYNTIDVSSYVPSGYSIQNAVVSFMYNDDSTIYPLPWAFGDGVYLSIGSITTSASSGKHTIGLWSSAVLSASDYTIKITLFLTK